MSWFESLILGLVQGLTEFLPVSSSAHLRLTAAFSGWKDPGAAFTTITQIGTEAAVLIYFRRDVGRIVTAWARSLANKEMRRDHDTQTGWLVIVGSIPIGVLGLLFEDQIEGPFRDLRITATMLIVIGVVIGVADRLAARRQISGFLLSGARLYVFAVIGHVGRRIRILGATAHPTASWVAQAASDLADGLDQAQVVVADDKPDPGQTAFAQVTHGAGNCRFAANPVAALRGERGERWTMPPLSHSILKSGGNSRSKHSGPRPMNPFMKSIPTKSFMPFVWYRIALGTVIIALVTTGALSPHAAESAG